jgi:iron complex outermembrane receptor protein
MLTAIAAFSQTGTIKGTIKTSDGYPAESVTITLKGTAVATASEKSGGFELKKVRPGKYTLIASFTGLEPTEMDIEVLTGNTTTVPERLLKENAQQLNEVVISSNRKKKESEYVAKMPLKDLENPQVYNVVSSEILKQQAITSYDDALKNVPGIARTWESTGRAYGDGASYFALRGLESQPTMYNGLPGLTSGNLDPADIESIEVIKGPTGTLFGSSIIAYGGLINTITKKPYYDYGGEVTYTAGSFGLNRVTADVNIPLSKTEKIALRVNTAYHSEGSFQDAGFKKSFFFAPALSYEVNDRLSFHFLTEILNEERAVAPIFFHTNREDPLQFKTIKELNLNNDLSFTSNDLTIRTPRFNLQGQMLYKLSSQWTSQTAFARGVSKSDGFYSYIWPDVTGTNYFGQYFSNQQGTVSTNDIQQNFIGDFKIGKLRNRLVVGLDAFSRNNVDNSSGYGFARNVTPQGGENFVDPFTGDSLAPVYMTRASVDNLLANSGGTNSNVTNNAYSVYASDVLNITPGLLAMASVRVDYFDSKGEKSDKTDDFHQTAVSPKFGLVYQPIVDKISLFANYMNGFVNVAPSQVADPDGSNPRIKSFKPEQANQWEVGAKANLFSNKFSASVCYYDITVSNRVTGDPDNFYNSLQGGKMGSKGFEVDLSTSPFAGLNLIAGYAYNESKVIDGDENDFYSTPGRSAGGQGPNNLANLWATYKITQGSLRNFGVGAGGNYAGTYKVVDSKITGDFYLPQYTVLNATLFYNSEKIRVTLKLNNITDKDYYIGYWSVNPQKPRNIAASFAYKF